MVVLKWKRVLRYSVLYESKNVIKPLGLGQGSRGVCGTSIEDDNEHVEHFEYKLKFPW